jgi:hypothetical protein
MRRSRRLPDLGFGVGPTLGRAVGLTILCFGVQSNQFGQAMSVWVGPVGYALTLCGTMMSRANACKMHR